MRLAPRLSRWTILCLLVAGSTSHAADVKQLAAGLSAAKPADRYAAADALADLGYSAAEAVPALTTALQSDDANLRWRSARALGVIGESSAAESLAKAAGDTEAVVRAQAIFALGRLKASDEASLKVIVERLSDKEAPVRRAAVRALRMVEAPRESIRPLVLKLLDDSEPTIAVRALSSLVEGGVEIVPALAAALDQREARYWACLALGEIGPQAKAAVPALIKVLADDRPEVRLQATIALAEIGPDAKPAVGELVKLLADPFDSVRLTTAFALGRIGDEGATDALVKVEANADPSLRMLCTWALAKINKNDETRSTQALQRLVSALGDKNGDMANLAARALADLEADPAKVRPLVDKIVATNPEISDRVFGVFSSQSQRAIPQALEALNDPQRRVRALQVLSRIGPEAVTAVPGLLELLKAGDAATKTEVLYALGAIGHGATAAKMDQAVTAISDQLGAADPRVVQAAVYALGKIGPAAKSATASLHKLTQSEDTLLRLMAICAILRIDPVASDLVKTAQPILAEGLKHGREYVRVEAAMTLGEMGPLAKESLPALETAARDSSRAVRSAATAAIKKIKG